MVAISNEYSSTDTMWHFVVLFGNYIISRFPVCVKYRMVPFGILIAIGLFAFLRFIIGTPSAKNSMML